MKAQWYRLVQRSHRGYELLFAEFPLVVQHIIRVAVAFDANQRETRARLSFLNEQKHNAILSSIANIQDWHSS